DLIRACFFFAHGWALFCWYESIASFRSKPSTFIEFHCFQTDPFPLTHKAVHDCNVALVNSSRVCRIDDNRDINTFGESSTILPVRPMVFRMLFLGPLYNSAYIVTMPADANCNIWMYLGADT